MIDHSYLPSQSAREYQDTGIQNWIGFFLSQHTTELSDDVNKVTYLSEINMEKILPLISQVYAGQLTTHY